MLVNLFCQGVALDAGLCQHGVHNLAEAGHAAYEHEVNYLHALGYGHAGVGYHELVLVPESRDEAHELGVEYTGLFHVTSPHS